MTSENKVHTEVQEYYGKKLVSSNDLQTNACCTNVHYPSHIKNIMAKIHDEVMSKYYGCGLTIPTHLTGMKILDLGSGSGRDCYILSALVGESGEVIGVDMTQEQLDVALKHLDYHQKIFNHKKSNTKFLKGNIEHLDELNLPDDYFDIIISNCVINLVTDKQKVLNLIYKKLKKGGEFYFSDVYVDRRIPKHLVDNKILYGECLSGALYLNDFTSMAKRAGFRDPRPVESEIITISNHEIEHLLEGFSFFSTTFRLFKIDGLDDHCEDYGQAVCFKGDGRVFKLDEEHVFEKGRISVVCGNTYRMLNESRLSESFDFFGSFDNHFGLFEECATSTQDDNSNHVEGRCC